MAHAPGADLSLTGIMKGDRVPQDHPEQHLFYGRVKSFDDVLTGQGAITPDTMTTYLTTRSMQITRALSETPVGTPQADLLKMALAAFNVGLCLAPKIVDAQTNNRLAQARKFTTLAQGKAGA